ncbi:hypothetical protein [Polaribacter sp. IC063]|uniref:hypothetical protein n=1 Tax=Polaribacter sp. IC063 TaxID=57031 RepID=UPI0011BEA3FC|nr:hypothetical protein [Polaribacter sp. IC063]TXD54374.1 hypothetical protein ES043_00545 [Polaribacter sp. IC063]
MYPYNYSEKEHKEVINWRYNLGSPQMRKYNNNNNNNNNNNAVFLNHYRVQESLHEQVRKETLEFLEIIEKPHFND